jgi:hypothetical protein
MIGNPQLLPARKTLCLGALPEDLIDSFDKLQESLEWQCAGAHRAQIAPIVQTLHFGSMKVSFGRTQVGDHTNPSI